MLTPRAIFDQRIKGVEIQPMPEMKRLVFAVILVLASSGIGGVTIADEGVPRVAFFGFQFINTSPQPTTPEETQRIRMLNGSAWLIPQLRPWSPHRTHCPAGQCRAGMSNRLNYDSVADVRAKYPDFFWQMVRPYIGDALRYLRVTQEGQQ